MDVIKYILAIYAWVVIGVLIIFLARIAYFYEKTSGQQTRYYFLILPALLLAAGVVLYLTHNVEFTGQSAGDVLLCGGGIMLAIFGFRLQEFMTGERQ